MRRHRPNIRNCSLLVCRAKARSVWGVGFHPIVKELHVYAMNVLTSCEGDFIEEPCNIMHIDTKIEGV